MGRIAISIALIVVATAACCMAGCGTTPISTRAIEEKYLDEGYANRMYEYGEELLKQGRYTQAYTAFLDAEQTAYTKTLREAARKRRMWLGDSIAKMEKDGKPLPPKADLGEDVELPEPALPSNVRGGSAIQGQQVLPGLKPGSPSIVIPGPARLSASQSDNDDGEALE